MPSSKIQISALMAIYAGTRRVWFEEALASLLAQTVPVQEIVIVCDGPCDTELIAYVEGLKNPLIQLVKLTKNCGLGAALAHGVEKCVGNWILRMDDDDASVLERVRLQLDFLKKNPDIDVCGGQIEERASDMQTVLGMRKCPSVHDEIVARHKFRNAMNHVTILARREAIVAAGNYREGTIGYEDYDLWFRMIRSGYRFANLDKTLVNVRFDVGQAHSRVGRRAAAFEYRMQRGFLRDGHISVVNFIFNLAWRVPPRFLPAAVFLGVMKKAMRKSFR